jgi:hypothetical protein
MIKTLLLICTLSMPQADCSAATAEAVIQGPDATSLTQCGLHGQAYIAHGAIAGYLDGGHYLKIACTSGARQDALIQPIESAGQLPIASRTTD